MTHALIGAAAPSSSRFDSVRQVEYPRLTRDLSVAVVVVGAGITGLTTAWLLQRAGVDVAVLDAGLVGGGATGESAGHLTTCLDTDYHTLIAVHGPEVAQATAQACALAIDFIEDTVRRIDAACAFERVPGYLYAEQPMDLVGLGEEAEAVARVGLSAQLVREVPLPFAVAGALRFERQAQLQPRAYLAALARTVDGKGGVVFGHTPVVEVEDGAPCRVQAGGHTVRAGAVELATHTPIGRALSLQTRLEPRRTYMLAARVDELPAGLYWDRAHPYHHMRAAKDLLLVGGFDHRTGEVQDARDCFSSLEAYTRARFAVRSIERRWSNQVFEPIDGLPFIGSVPDRSHVFVGTGYAGTGLTFGTVAGEVLAGLITGQPSRLSEVLRPSRVGPVTASARIPAASTEAPWKWVVARLRGCDAHLVADLHADAGRVIEIDGQRAAVYRDAGERLHFLSPRCTHAGCTVRWNQAERSWDCPCHGGRFDPLGAVLCAPPVRGLDLDDD